MDTRQAGLGGGKEQETVLCWERNVPNTLPAVVCFWMSRELAESAPPPATLSSYFSVLSLFVLSAIRAANIQVAHKSAELS